MRKIMFLMISFLGVAAVSQAAVPVTTRYDWVSEDGSDLFHADQGGGGSWTETVNGVPTYHFVQTERTDGYVALYDASRDLHVWLYPSNFYLRSRGETTPHVFRNGHWDDRRLFSYRLSDGSLNYFNLYPGKIWRWARGSGVITNASETLRNTDQVQMYEANQHITFSLVETQVWAKFDGGAWFKLADGVWSR